MDRDVMLHAAQRVVPAETTRYGLVIGINQYAEIDVAKAAALYQKACDGGMTVGCTNLGLAYKDGRGVERDVVKTATLFQKAATVETCAAA
jgi:TPR repeat protein